MPTLALSNIVNTSRSVNPHFEHLALGGNESWPGRVDRTIRRRAARRLGALGYAVLLTRTSDDGRDARSELVASRIDQLAATVVPKPTPAERSTHVRRRRITTWDAWAQAAMAAEDLEILLTALTEWRSNKDLFDALAKVEAQGPTFFQRPTKEWSQRLRVIATLPRAGDLLPILTAPQAALLEAGLGNSVREASDDLYALASLVPWDVRLAMMRYKHGFTWLIPAIAPFATDPVGLTRLKAAPDTAFVVRTGHGSGLIFTCTDEEIAAALAATRLACGLDRFVCRAVLSEAESSQGTWGVALYGESAADEAQRALAEQVEARLRSH